MQSLHIKELVIPKEALNNFIIKKQIIKLK